MDHKKPAFLTREAAILTALAALAFAVRCYFMRYHTIMVPDYDGVEYIGFAKTIFTAKHFNMLRAPGYPILISLALPFFSEPQYAAMFVSGLFGSLICVAVYFLVKEVMGRKAALLAGALIVVFPDLVMVSTYAMSDMPYAFFMYMGLYCSLVFMRRRDLVSALFFGGVFGAGYLTRSEAMPIFIAACAVIAASWFSKKSRGNPIPWKEFAAAVLLFMVFAVPYMVHVRNLLGSWSISGKIGINLKQGGDAVSDAGSLAYIAANLSGFARKYGENFAKLADIVKLAYPRALIFIAAVGGIAIFFRDRQRPYGALILLLPLFAAIALPLFYVDYRIISSYQPELLIFIAAATVTFEDSISRIKGAGILKKTAPVCLSLLIGTGYYYYTGLEAYYNSADYQAETGFLTDRYIKTGEVLKKNTSPGDGIVAREALLVYYTGRDFIGLPDYDPARLHQYAIEKGARYIIVDDSCIRKRPQLGPLLGPFMSMDYPTPPGFRLVYMDKYCDVAIYEVEG